MHLATPSETANPPNYSPARVTEESLFILFCCLHPPTTKPPPRSIPPPQTVRAQADDAPITIPPSLQRFSLYPLGEQFPQRAFTATTAIAFLLFPLPFDVLYDDRVRGFFPSITIRPYYALLSPLLLSSPSCLFFRWLFTTFFPPLVLFLA